MGVTLVPMVEQADNDRGSINNLFINVTREIQQAYIFIPCPKTTFCRFTVFRKLIIP